MYRPLKLHMNRLAALVLLMCFWAGGILRATPPGQLDSLLQIFEFGDTVIIAWPQQEHADQTGRALLTAVDARTGAERWSWRGPRAAYMRDYVFPQEERQTLIFVERGQSAALSVLTGDVVWQSPAIIVAGKNIGFSER